MKSKLLPNSAEFAMTQGTTTLHTPAPDPTDDRRANRRYRLDLDAMVDVAGRWQPCAIRDVCAGGMFLAFPERGVGPVTGGLDITVRFVIHEGQTRRSTRFSGRVVRASADSAGVAFVNPDPDDLHAILNFAAGRQQVSARASASNADKFSPQLDAATARSLVEDCNRLVAASLGPLLKGVFSTLGRRLLNAASSTPLVSERSAYSAATEQLYETENRSLEVFRHAGEEHWRNFACVSEAVHKTWSDISESSLSLVDDTSLENWLAVADITNSVENQHKEELAGLERRLSMVFGVRVNRENNPYGPHIISECFQKVIADFAWPQSANILSYKCFRDVFNERATTLYGPLNELLIKQGILPKLNIYKADKLPSSAPRTSAADEGLRAPASKTPGQTVNLGAQSIGVPAANAGQAAPSPLRRPDLYQVVRELRELYTGPSQSRLDHGNVGLAQPEPAAPAGEAYNIEELLEALSRLQGEQVENVELGSPQDVRARLLQVLSGGAGGGSHKHVSDHDDTVIDVAENLFKVMFQDPMVADSVKHWLQRLELPLMRLALHDSTLFLDKSHVARQVINKIAQLEIYGASSATGQNSIQSTVDKLVDRIVQGLDGDTEVFSETLKQLDRLVQTQDKAHAENLSDVVKSCQQVQPVPGAISVEVDVYEEEREHWIKTAGRLREGDWLLLKNAEHKPERVQLAWKSENREIFVLVNLLGQWERTLDLDTMARLLCAGIAVPLSEAADPALDRAQYSLLQDLHDQLLHQSAHDPLTGLINRGEFESALRRALAEVKRTDIRHVFCFIDVDQFGAINASCGHAAGDELLKAMATMIVEQSADKGILGRLGGDEFGLLLGNCSLDDALVLAEKQIQTVGEFRFQWEDKRMSIRLSIGIVPLNERSESVAQIWHAAESSCRVAKDLGGHRLQVYHAGHARLSHQEMMMKWIGKIDWMLEQKQLFLRCQRIMPIFGGASDRPRFEILLGVRDDLGEVHSPQQFIEAAEWYHRMPAVDRWVARHALEWMGRNRDLVEKVEGFAINLSGQSVADDGFADFIIAELDSTQVPRDKVCFEVTETAGIGNLSDAAVFIQQIRDIGCKFSLDDFGSGLSSYAYLKNLPVDVLKIDGAFVKNMDTNKSDYAVVKSVCEVAHFMGKKVVAEYVESEAVLKLLREIGVDYAQGFFIERPVVLEHLSVDG